MPKALSFYYDLMSQPSRAMWIIMKMSGTPFQDCPVALRKGEHMTEEYKQNINRFQRAPCINDNGFKLAESIAILRYLSAKGQISSSLYPTDISTQARVDEALEWQHLGVRLGCAMYFRKIWLEPMLTGKEISAGKVAQLKEIMEQSLDVVENVFLEKSKYLTGDKISAADVFIACEIEQTRMAGYDARDSYPKIKEWLKNVQTDSNPYYDAAHKIVNKIAGPKAKL